LRHAARQTGLTLLHGLDDLLGLLLKERAHGFVAAQHARRQAAMLLEQLDHLEHAGQALAGLEFLLGIHDALPQGHRQLEQKRADHQQGDQPEQGKLDRETQPIEQQDRGGE
jgi:hypothetical protein